MRIDCLRCGKFVVAYVSNKMMRVTTWFENLELGMLGILMGKLISIGEFWGVRAGNLVAES